MNFPIEMRTLFLASASLNPMSINALEGLFDPEEHAEPNEMAKPIISKFIKRVCPSIS